MPWSAGVFNRANGPTGWQDDAAASIGIEADRHDNQDNDFRNGINNCLTKDGTNTPTANLNLGGFKITSLGNATTTGDAINYTQITNGLPLGIDYLNNRVGIGTNAPTYVADVLRTANDANSRVRISNASNGAAAQTGFQIANDTGTGSLLLNSSGNSTGGGANSLNVVQSGNAPIHFWTNGTIKQTILGASGFVGFNQPNPGVLIDALRNANDTFTRIRIANQSNGSNAFASINIGNDTNVSACDIRVQSSTNPTGAGANSLSILHGLSAPIRVRAGGSGGVDLAPGATTWAAVSDERFKKNIQNLDYGLSEIKSLDPIRFDYIEDEGNSSARVGFIAQAVKPIIPEAVRGSEETQYTFAATELIPVLVNAIKQLEARVAALEA